jgi:Zn finger protein HypA/HybF involved in hydrogenase expression
MIRVARLIPLVLIVVILSASTAKRIEEGRPDAACPSCWPEYIIEGQETDTNGWEDTPLVWDDCENARHVHSYTWSSVTYECPRCTASWNVFEHAPACPTCGWHRTDPVMKYDPCKDL